MAQILWVIYCFVTRASRQQLIFDSRVFLCVDLSTHINQFVEPHEV